ncbi:MAG: hypothetical protein KJ579_04375, partial [Verrucomicrobia bacterium]|nr:hypothetical protein [Verrucomicrobiota bacterium]
MYVLLLAGSATMVWPLLQMVGGSLRGAADQREQTLVPAYLRDDAALWRRYVEALFNESLDLAAANLGVEAVSFESFPVPAAPAGLVDAWEAFLASGDEAAPAQGLGFVRAEVSKCDPCALRGFREELRARFGGDCDRLNREWGADFSGWAGFHLQMEDRNSRRNPLPPGPFLDAFLDFKARQPPWMRFEFSVEGFFRRGVLRSRYGRDVAALNRARGTSYASFGEVPLPARAPESGAARTDWEIFVRDVAPPRILRVDGQPAPRDLSGIALDRISIATPEAAFREHLRARFGSDPAAAAAALGLRRAGGRGKVRGRRPVAPRSGGSRGPVGPGAPGSSRVDPPGTQPGCAGVDRRTMRGTAGTLPVAALLGRGVPGGHRSGRCPGPLPEIVRALLGGGRGAHGVAPGL